MGERGWVPFSEGSLLRVWERGGGSPFQRFHCYVYGREGVGPLFRGFTHCIAYSVSIPDSPVWPQTHTTGTRLTLSVRGGRVFRVPFRVTRCVCVPYCRYVSLDREMEEISCVWRNAKEHLNHHHHHHHVRRRDIIYMNYQLTTVIRYVLSSLNQLI